MPDDARQRYSSRKFIITGSALVMAFGLTIAGKLTAEFATVVTVCVGAYNIANAWAAKNAA